MTVTSLLVGLLLAQAAPEVPSLPPPPDPDAVKEAAPADEAKAASKGEPKTEEEAKLEGEGEDEAAASTETTVRAEAVPASDAAATADDPAPENDPGAAIDAESAGVEEIHAVGVHESTSFDDGVDGEQPAVAVEAGSEASQSSEKKRFWKVNGGLEYRMLVITDPDPKNDVVLIYRAGGSVAVTSGVRAFFSIGMSEGFYPEPGESGFLFQDLSMGAKFGHNVPLPLGWAGLPDREVEFAHQAALFVPTSRASQNQDLYAAPRWVTAARVDIAYGIAAGIDAMLQYNFNRYAERAGPQGGMNQRFIMAPALAVDYGLELPEPLFGDLSAGFNIGTAYILKYPSRDDHLSDTSSRAKWDQLYSWGISVGWTPLEYTTVSVALEHGGSVLRDGIVNLFVTHRDETELVFRVTGNY